MSADRDTTRIVRSWLRTDEHESADRILDDVLGRLDTTRQRRSWWPAWRIADMNNVAKLAIGVAAVAVVVVVGINLLAPRSDGGVGGPSASPMLSPSPGASPPTSAAQVPSILDRALDGTLSVGGDYVTDPAFPVPFSMKLPAGWAINLQEGIALEGTRENGLPFLGFYPIQSVVHDPCHPASASPVPGDTPTKGEIVDDFQAMKDFDTTIPTVHVIGGRMVTWFRLSNAIDTDTANCDGGALLPILVTTDGARPATNGGTSQQIRVFDTAGFPGESLASPSMTQPPLVVVVEFGNGAPQADQERIVNDVLESMTFE
jgi:hypothetical protein